MKTKSYKVDACNKCFSFTREITEEYNGTVPVLCFCDLRNGLHKMIKTSIVGGVITYGSVHIMWTPTSNHFHENRERWHIRAFSGMGWSEGQEEHLPILKDWIVSQKKRQD